MNFLALITATACGLSGGALFAFSSFVMPALSRLPASAAVQAMQAINVAAPRSIFMLPLLGSAVGSVLIGVRAAVDQSGLNRPLLIAGSITGLSVLAITVVYHVPRNNALASISPTSANVTATWAAYASGWTRWNHLRSATGLISAGLLIAAIRDR